MVTADGEVYFPRITKCNIASGCQVLVSCCLQVSSKQVKVGEQFDLVVRITNPFDFTLKTCVLNVEGPGIQDDLNIPLE